MNKIIIMGRITKDIELKTYNNDKNYCKFSVAVDRKYKNADGSKVTDFFNVTAWSGTAKFITNYFNKGQQITIVGEMQQQHYKDNNGVDRVSYDINAEEVYFCGSKSESNNTSSSPNDNLDLDFSFDDTPF